MANETPLKMDKTLDGFASEKINTISNRMLGEIDKAGNYVISQPIKDELLKLTKFKKTTFNNSIFCVVNRPGIGELVFKVDYEKNSKDNVAKATIYLLENSYKVNGYFQDTIQTKIGEYTGSIDGFIENSYNTFNISTKWDEDDVKEDVGDVVVNNYEYLTAQKQFLESLNKLTVDRYNKIYEEFFTDKLKVINSLGNNFSKAVLEDFRNEYAKIERFFLSNKDYKALSELLDICIERNRLGKEPITPEEIAREKEEKEYFEQIKLSIEQFTRQAERIRENAVEKAKNRLNEQEQQKLQEIVKPKVEQAKEAEEPAKAPAEKKPEKPKAQPKQAEKPKPVAKPKTVEPTVKTTTAGTATMSAAEWLNELRNQKAQHTVKEEDGIKLVDEAHKQEIATNKEEKPAPAPVVTEDKGNKNSAMVKAYVTGLESLEETMMLSSDLTTPNHLEK